MKPKDRLLERWETILAKKGDQPAIFSTGGDAVRTFRQIDDRAREFETNISNFDGGSVLGVQIGNNEDWPSILLACLEHGVLVLPLEQSISEKQSEAALRICRASGIVNKFDTVRKLDSPSPWPSNPPSLLKLTSGTTAAPRAISFHSEQLLADCDQICETKGISDADLNFGVIPVSHSYGFSNLITPLIARGVPMVISRDRTPRAVLDDLARTKATVFPGMPVFYQAFCEMEDVPPVPKLRLCISAGAPLPLAIAKKFREKFGLAIHSFYGASECGGICYDREGTVDVEGYVGTPMKGVEVEIIDPGADSSQIRVRGTAVGDGYFPDAEQEKLGSGVFVPDDLLARCGEGFQIVGRVSDVINIAGKKVNPAEIEDALLRVPGVRQAVAFGRSAAAGLRNEEVAACVVGDAGLEEPAVVEACRKSLSGWQVPKRIFIVAAIPANERGKISRKDLAKRFTL
ncbi:MAG TPA: class I adenylate-forming enzyme family protein [Chthoniobacterales bacterium]|nr:class I adenylate-forming enzyme family protein [Chthoniobacterales bacterium]